MFAALFEVIHCFKNILFRGKGLECLLHFRDYNISKENSSTNMDQLWLTITLILINPQTFSAKYNVIRLTQNLEDKGFEEDTDLGELVAEQVVDSPAACGQLCQANPVCRSVMLMGQLCRMFGYAHECPMTTVVSIAHKSHYPPGNHHTSHL